MSVELKIPTVGESVTEAMIGRWFKEVGDYVRMDEPVAELETDKVTLELPSPVAGRLEEIRVAQGDTAQVGDIIGLIDETAEAPADDGQDQVGEAGSAGTDTKTEEAPQPASDAGEAQPTESGGEAPGHVMPAARRLAEEKGVALDQVRATGPGGRVLKEDVQRALEAGRESKPVSQPSGQGGAGEDVAGDRREERVPMSPIRRRIASRLVEAQQTAALLTTFNEIDMTAVKALRKSFQDSFVARHDVKLGFMSFFVKAAVDALRQCPQLNAEIDGEEIVYRDYYDVGIAVSTERGLLVPILKSAERLSFSDIERKINDFGSRAREGKIQLNELEGGTFTISNGGVFGSLMSTPIVNPPQSGVLGLHAIQDRPVAIDGAVVIRPMMYVALTYDHRIVDGREAVTFLRRIKEAVEEPSRMLIEA